MTCGPFKTPLKHRTAADGSRQNSVMNRTTPIAIRHSPAMSPCWRRLGEPEHEADRNDEEGKHNVSLHGMYRRSDRSAAPACSERGWSK